MTARRIAWALAAYGALGLALLAVGGALAIDAAARTERLAGSADGALAAAIDTATAAADAFRGTDASLGQGESSARQAATLSREASATLTALADAMRLTIFGTQPLVGLSDDFATSAEQAAALASELDGVGTSLAASRDDLSAVAEQLGELAGQLAELRGASGDAPSGPPLRLLLAVLMAWLTLPSIAALVAAGWLLRSARAATRP